MSPPVPESAPLLRLQEDERLSRLRDHDLTPGQRLPEYDELARLAAVACDATAAYVNIIGDVQVWSLGLHPCSEAEPDAQHWARDLTLCARMAHHPEEMVVADTLADPRTAEWADRASGQVPFRFYAGMPLLGREGHVLGSFCILGPAPRVLQDQQLQSLRSLRNLAGRLLAARLERKVLERDREALAQRQEAFEQSMEVAGETFWDWNLQTNEMGHARNRARMLGYEDGQMPPHLDSWVAVSHVDDQEPVRQLIRAHLAGHTPEYEAEYRQRHRDGHWVWVRSRGRVVERDPVSGQPLRMRGTVVDITRRKELEARIAQMNEDLLQLLRSLPDAVLQKDTQGRWIFANPQARKVFTDSEDGVSDEGDLRAWDSRALLTTLETRVVDGRAREYEVQRVPLFDAMGQPKALVLIGRDLWHQREQEDILRRALEQAEEAARSKSQFLATMAHEIRTPLNSVVGAARLALMEEDRARQEEHLQLVNQASQMLLDLLNTVLDHSRLESGALPMELMPLSPRQLLNQVGLQMAPAARAKGLQWSTRVDQAVPSMVLGDSLRLRQVLTNLVGNAIKFTDSGSIEVLARVQAESPAQPAHLCIEVSDTGIGLTPEQQARLFKAFSQADATIARRYGGTGLGLSISRQIMLALGGGLTVSSERGRGSTFVLSWPIKEVAAGAAVEDGTSGAYKPDGGAETLMSGPERGADMARLLEEAGRELSGRRVLVVDDNRMNVAVVRRLLERAGLSVITAGSGLDALHILRTTGVDLVLMDLYMPEINGDEAARRIRSELGLHSLPVIALSASVTLEERERCAAAGMDDFVSKPIEPLELLSAMADCLAP